MKPATAKPPRLTDEFIDETFAKAPAIIREVVDSVEGRRRAPPPAPKREFVMTPKLLAEHQAHEIKQRAQAKERGRAIGSQNSARTRQVDTLVDLRHALDEAKAASQEIAQIDTADASFRVSDRLGAPLSRVTLARKLLTQVLRRYGVEIDDE